MNWKTILTDTPHLSPDEARDYIQEHESGSYQLLDVRQPKEYQQGHLPGALLIPLKELLTRTGELDQTLPILVYCRSGNRSKAACQFLSGRGFEQVFNITGGILRWNGITLDGPETKGMAFFVDGDFSDAFQMAFRMEQGLKEFYLALTEFVTPQEQKDLLKRMASFEDGHMAMLLHQYQGHTAPETDGELSLAEGAVPRDRIIAAYKDQINAIEDIIHIGMMFETQAFDLYSRLARQTDNPEKRAFYRQMAREEQSHLDQLTRELDKLLK